MGLEGPSRTIIVEPQEIPEAPAVEPEPEEAPVAPEREPEKVPA